jgi:hypothetical protein
MALPNLFSLTSEVLIGNLQFNFNHIVDILNSTETRYHLDMM